MDRTEETLAPLAARCGMRKGPSCWCLRGARCGVSCICRLFLDLKAELLASFLLAWQAARCSRSCDAAQELVVAKNRARGCCFGAAVLFGKEVGFAECRRAKGAGDG